MSWRENIQIKRVYEKPAEDDGYRVLIDRLWPRGLQKKNAAIDEWNKTIAPSTELRKWFNHEEAKFTQFAINYAQQLIQQRDELNRLRTIATSTRLTLLYASKDPAINHAVILKNILSKKQWIT
jgi:uncharacterized protein YeaO (DUF488 family)